MAWCHFVHGYFCAIVVLLLQCFSGLQRCNSAAIDGVSSSSSSSIMIASRALLDFKAGLTFATNSQGSVLPSWTNASNPCNASQPWEGVTCSDDAASGDVIVATLRLGGRGLSGAIPPNPLARLCEAGLTVLDLSNNNLLDSVPIELGACISLYHLNLSYNYLSGSLAPALFSNLTALRSLDLSNNNFSTSIPVELGACRSLYHLNLYNNSFSGSLVPSFFSNLSALRYLDLSYNYLSGSLAPTLLSNLSALRYLDLSVNNFSSSLPPPIWHLPALRTLILVWPSENQVMQAPDIPEDLPFCANITELRVYGVSLMSMRNPMMAFSKCKKLQYLVLRSTNLTGTIPEDLWQLPSLKHLDLRSPGAVSTSSLPTFMASCNNLQYLSLVNVPLGGVTLPPSLIVNCKKLQFLQFAQTGMQGVVPRLLWELPVLEFLVLEEPNLTSQASLPPQLPSCGTIEAIIIQGVNLSGEIQPSLGSCSTLQWLVLSGVGMRGPIPKTLGNLVGLKALVLNNNSLSGSIPENIGNMWQLGWLDLSMNNLSGSLPQGLGNNLKGDAPAAALVACTSLEVLLLYQNSLTGALEQLQLWMMKNLATFMVQQNQFHGRVTSNLTRSGSNLQLVDLGSNNLSGELPREKENQGLRGLRVLIVSNNRLSGEIPTWLWELPSLQVLDLSYCHLVGEILPSIAHLLYFKRNDHMNITTSLEYDAYIPIMKGGQKLGLPYLSSNRISLDLSHNSINGCIPDSLGELVGLTSLDLSHNSLSGPIPPSLGNLSQLDALDLSSNSLQGTIPSQLGFLFTLGILNLSNNQLVGNIPTTNNFNTRFGASCFQGNTGLCGSPLPNPCITNTTTTTTNKTTNSDDTTVSSWFDDNISLGGLVLGYILGLLGALCLLWWRNTKDRWFKQIHKIHLFQIP